MLPYAGTKYTRYTKYVRWKPNESIINESDGPFRKKMLPLTTLTSSMYYYYLSTLCRKYYSVKRWSREKLYTMVLPQPFAGKMSVQMVKLRMTMLCS